MTWTVWCSENDHYVSMWEGGGVWFHASGALDPRIWGEYHTHDTGLCDITDYGCDFDWLFAPVVP